MSPKYKLNYFDTRGTGEPIRYILSYAKVDFEDNRIKHEDWPKIKSSTPFGQLPTLEVDGKVINQSVAICRYLGKEFGIAGADNWEALQIDAVVDNILDFKTQLNKVISNKDPNEKKELREKLLNETLPFLVNKLESRLKDNKGYLVNGKLTWGDLYLVSIFELLDDAVPEDVRKKAINTLALKEKVQALPGIKAWIARRPPHSHSLAQMLS